ncbi:MAG: PD40 domain-containing protein [Lentisphaeria bacterium]|nr:PD40 domain-containing protein [Lentisphaeria bacterium]
MNTFPRNKLPLSLIALAMGAALMAAPKPQGNGTSVMDLPNEDIYVHGLVELGDTFNGALTIDWSEENNRILFERRGLNQYYNVYSATPDGFRLTAVTLNMPDASTSRHCGNPNWAEDGQFFVFTAQNAGSGLFNQTIPGFGLHCNIWLGNKDSSIFWQLTKVPTDTRRPKGVAMPHVSPDKKRLFWCGNTGRIETKSPWRQRALYMGKLSYNGAKAELTGIQEFMPGESQDFYESYGFSPSGDSILFSGNLDAKQPWYGMDLYVIENKGKQLRRLTNSPIAWDRFPIYSKNGKKIIWSSSQGMRIHYFDAGAKNWHKSLSTELWIMDADGSTEPKRLTFFNRRGHAHFQGKRCFIGGMTSTPSPSIIAITLRVEDRLFDVKSRVILIKLGEGESSNSGSDTRKKKSGRARLKGSRASAKPGEVEAAPKGDLPVW